MNIAKRTSLLIIALTILVSFSAVSQKLNLPVAELMGKKYYVYKAKKGESMFGVARMFNWDDRTLSELNPTATSPLKKGMLLYYPIDTQNATDDNKKAEAKTAIATGELRHKVQRGETVYGIASMYNIPVERIYSLNPGSSQGIKSGESLLIRKSTEPATTIDNSDKAVFYSVKQGDTLYSLSKAFGVSVAAIMESNPGVDEQNFKAGSTVKIPKRGAGIKVERKMVEVSTIDSVEMKKVSKNDTWHSIAAENGLSVETLRDANPSVHELKNKEYVVVPRIETVTEEKDLVVEDPRETTAGGIAEIYEDVHKLGDADDSGIFEVRVAVVAENPAAKKDQEFLRGFLTGIDRQKRKDYKISFKVIGENEGREAAVVQLREFRPDLVFTTSDSELPEYICTYAQQDKTPVINTFDVKSTSYSDNPYIVQLLSPSTLFNDNVAEYAKKRYSGRTLLMVGEPDSSDQLAESLRKIWDPSKIRDISFEEMLPERFDPSGSYLVYGYATKKQEVADLVKQVGDIRDQRPLADVSMLGRPNLIVYEEAMLDDFKRASVSIPSRFYIDRESPEYREFLQRYRLLFDRTPIRSLPLYAAVGYDTSNYFIPAYADAHGDMNRLQPSRNMVQSDFELWRTSNWSGFLNPPVYVIDYTSYGSVNKNLVSYGE